MTDDKEKSAKKVKSKIECFGYPLSIFFIVVNEFCERFSYYGMRAVLTLYFKNFLKWDEDLSTSIYHAFTALCYLTPILGAIIADSWLGKFKTIVYLSIVYTIGQVVMAISAITEITDGNSDGKPDTLTIHVVLSMVGLFLIAFGTGGIKPCVAAFGGDQFQDHQEKQRSTFFSIFYLSINAGSLLSTLITPIMKAQKCGTAEQCYPLAFGIPAALMFVALIVFIAGSSMYYKAEPQGNIILQVFKCIGFALKNRFKHRSSKYPKREHWMDWATEKYDKLLIAQVKMVLKVLFLYIPLPMFWALFDQQGSRWTFQTTTMDGSFGTLTIQPEHMQMVNPILILILVPIMDSLVYPLIKKCHLNFTPLKRMTVGMFFAAMAFVAAAATPDFLTYETMEINVTFNNSPPVTFDLKKSLRQTLLITPNITDSYLIDDLTEKPALAKNDIRFVNGLSANVSVKADSEDLGVITPSSASNYIQFPKASVTFVITYINGSQCKYSTQFGFGSSYTFLISSKSGNCQESIVAIEDIKPSTIPMAWQIPQYFLITMGEVVFSVTGLEFSYSQAPSNMKSVLQAGWLFSVAVGNIIVMIVAEAGTLPLQWAEYLLFASLLVAVCIIFSIMAYFYTYNNPVEMEAQIRMDENEKDKKEKGDIFPMERKDSAENPKEAKQTKI
ncbi:solute carrier family 15 member 1-like [Scleropages formosus]|uniref:Solute carrier family 15 member 1-like n=1 Tax=Scleropages formosus TaxID=113540 RepID=A0A0P7VCY8_SCLFO|nr:solute carrier family 15 member 1-like [Scleropages formosus]